VIPDDTPVPAIEELAATMTQLLTGIDAMMSLADKVGGECNALWMATERTYETSGHHGLQVCYERLKEAKMWTEDALKELNAHEKP
jgi:hypothetical protein